MIFVMFYQKQRRICLNTDSIHSIRRGMELGRLLELPYSSSFNGSCITEILASEGCVRPFNQLRYISTVCTSTVNLSYNSYET